MSSFSQINELIRITWQWGGIWAVVGLVVGIGTLVVVLTKPCMRSWFKFTNKNEDDK